MIYKSLHHLWILVHDLFLILIIFLLGLYFHYELSPVQVVFEVKHKTFGSFITACSAIIGGVYTVVGMLDGMVGGFSKFVEKGVGSRGALA